MINVGGRGIFSKIPIIGDVVCRRSRKVSLYASLQKGSISDRLFVGDIEVFKAQLTAKRESTIRKHIHALIGKGDMQVFLSPEYADVCKLMSENPEETIAELRKVAEETAESKEIVKKILRRLSHSQDEAVRAYAFNEL